MSTIIDRIYQERLVLLRRAVEPQAVYLGYEEYRELRSSVGALYTVYEPQSSVNGACDKVFNLPIYRVEADKHLRVV